MSGRSVNLLTHFLGRLSPLNSMILSLWIVCRTNGEQTKSNVPSHFFLLFLLLLLLSLLLRLVVQAIVIMSEAESRGPEIEFCDRCWKKDHNLFPFSGLIQRTTQWWYFSYFSQKQFLSFHANCLQFEWNVRFDISCKLSPGDNLNKMSKPVFLRKEKT